MSMNAIFVSFTAFVIVMGLIPLAVFLAHRAGFVDRPGGRKKHSAPVPPVGGLIIFPIYMGAAVYSGLDFKAAWPLFAGLSLLLIVGALDDYRHVQPRIKFVVQVAAASIVVIAGQAELQHLGNLFGFGKVWLGFITVPFSIVAIVLLINAVNLMDGLDGLAAGMGFVMFFWLALAAALGGSSGELALILPLMVVLAGFLFYNMRSPWRLRSSIFLGDAGSMALGLLIAWFSIRLAGASHLVLPPIAVAWVLALPIIDICAQFYRRVRAGRHPFSPDRGHFQHHFKHAGIPTIRTVPMILLLVFLLGAVGYGGTLAGLPEWVLTLLWALLLFLHMALSRRPEIYMNFLRRFSCGN
jgi:UDP-GlcNAc:undecaprenyl-phosphate/decaprenyl-phosphate GlcNAc-1-phosphate transferase